MFFLFFCYFPVIILLLSWFFDIEWIFLILAFFFFHVFYGLKNISYDYIHQTKILLVIVLFFRLILLNFLNILIEIIF